ncbi:MAG: FmdB family transcriptional regulator [Chloroflexota bacterium]|nr:FmdB family transcriptional regulator [Chloroflexota bacterium]
MPTYDYQCRTCGTVTEVIHPMIEDGPSTCDLCGGQLRRVIFPSGIIFKGSGFYRNDSRASNAGSGETSEKSGGATKESAAKKDAGSGSTTPESTSTGSKSESSQTS